MFHSYTVYIHTYHSIHSNMIVHFSQAGTLLAMAMDVSLHHCSLRLHHSIYPFSGIIMQGYMVSLISRPYICNCVIGGIGAGS